jgi:hypothetical protein
MHGSLSQTLRKTTALTIAVVLISFVASTLTAQVGTRVGNFMYRGNAQLLDGRTIDVSDSMTALSSTFWSDVTRDTTFQSSETPSIMFVIDNSGSMGVNSPHNDPQGQRFVITRAFLDTIQIKYPDAEVGLAVFGTHLYFDTLDKAAHPYFTQTNPLYQHDVAGTNRGAYVRLLRLDSTYANYGGQSGYTILRNILDTAHYRGRDFSNNYYNFVGLRYLPTTPTLGGINDAEGWPYTNITAGFDAAKSAMDSASASRCSRYIIFLSDGDANRPTGAAQWYFRDSTANVPTTFTVFFPAGNVPTSIRTMTDHIRVNNYDLSVTPPDTGCTGRSMYWSCNSADLMGTLSTNIWSIISLPNRVDPTLIQINTTYLSTDRVTGDTAFQFTNMIPLTGQITPVNVNLIYTIYQNNVKVKDSLISINYNVRTMPHATPVWNPSKADSFSVWTWDRDHVFRYNSAVIPNIIETMDSIEVYFTFDSGSAHYGYDHVYIDLYNKIAPVDSQGIQLTRVSDRVFSGKFKRVVSAAANRGETPPLLQYRGAADSIIAVFRNRENLTSGKERLPLDTLRKAIGFVGINMTMSVTNDTIDAGDTTQPMRPSVNYSTGGAVPDTWVVRRLTWTQLPTVWPNDRIIAATGQYSRFTATRMDMTTPRQIQITLTLPNGATSSVVKNVYVRPAAASRLWIEADNSPDMYTPNPLGTMVFTSAMTLDSAWAVLRDRFNNLVSYSTSTGWVSRNTAVVTAREVPAHAAIGEGEVTKLTLVDSTWVVATNTVNTSLRDSIRIIISNVAYDSVRILRNIAGTLTPIFVLYDTIPNPVTLYVRAHRVDGLGGNNGWTDVPGNWGISAALSGKTTTFAPTNSNTWAFAPNDTGHGTIWVTVPGVSEIDTLNPVVFTAGPPNVMYIYPALGTPTSPWPAAPATADTMSADASYSLLYAKLFYRTVLGKEIWLPQYETDYTLANQIRWSANGPRDTVTPDYSNHTTLVSRQAYRVTTVTATWNALSYSMNIYVEPGPPHHIVIEATPTVQDLIHDDPLATLTIPPTGTVASAYARVRDRLGNYIGASVNSLWSSTSTAVFTAVKGDSATGEGRAVRVAAGIASMIASDAVAWPGVTMRDTVQVVVSDIYHQAVRIYVLTPSYDPYVDTVTIPTDSSRTLYAEGQRSDDTTQWEPVQVYWGKDASLITATNPPGSPAYSWTVVPDYIGSGRIWITRNEGYFTVADTVWAVFTEGDPESVALYRSLGDPGIVPAFPAIDTVAAGSTDSIFAKIFDRNRKWLSRFETDIALAQATISWAIQPLSGPGRDTLGVRTGRRTTFSPQTAFTTYRVTATFTQGSLVFAASAVIYVRSGTPTHIVIEGSAGPGVEETVDDNPLLSVNIGPYDTTYTQVYAIIRDTFGNFCDYSHNPDWWSGDIAVVTATRGTEAIALGQGRIDRVTPNTGSAFVMARDLDNGALSIDSVSVVLGSVPWDSLRITLRDPLTFLDTVQIRGIYTMQSGDTTNFYVQARRAVINTWENIPANAWQYIAALGSKSGPANSHVWRFGALDTARYGMITAISGGLSASITIEITAGNPASLVIYTDSLPPLAAGNARKPDPPQFVTVAAGTRDTMAALIFDGRGVFLPQYLGGAEGLAISWTATSRTFGDDLTPRLLGVPGPVKYFSPTRAYDTVLVVASLTTALRTMRDTVLFVVQHGTVIHMALEKTPAYNRYTPDYCDTISIASTAQSGSAYGILRDQFNNAAAPFYATLTSATIVRSNNDSFAVNIPLSNIGEVRALRLGKSDTGMIRAWDSHNSDSCVVILLPYFYDSLRITSASYPNGFPDGYTLTMTSNDSTAIYVQGRRSDNPTVWEDISATWEIVPALQPILPPGRDNHSYMVSPTDTGRGWVRVTMGVDAPAGPDTLLVRFTAGCAVRATITILTPPSQRIAGQPITAVDSLFDADNHLIRTPSLVVNPAMYHDAIDIGGTRPQPTMLVSGNTVNLGLSWNTTSQTFTGGVSTFTFTLYYAPAAPVSTDSMHRIFTSLSAGCGSPLAQTERFILLPGPLDSVVMEMNGVAILSADTVKIFYDSAQSSANLFSRGYDQYGNNLGFVATDWSVTDSLHPIASGSGDSVTNIDYSTSDPSFSGGDEGGWMITQDPGNPAIIDSQYVFIFGPLIRLDSAVTGDWSGNGLLDHMTLYFSRPFALPVGSGFEGLIIANATPNVNFTPDIASYSILNNTGSPSAVWVVAFNEQLPGSPQTAWTPSVQIDGQQNAEGRYIVKGTTISSFDGAGPVIWSVVEQRPADAQNDRSRDTVIVTFSEPVKRSATRDNLQQTDDPRDLFFVWADDTVSGGYLIEEFKLDNIDNQYNPPVNSAATTVVTFLMLNGQDLNGRNLLNIDTVMDFIVDAVTDRYNAPNDNNQKVYVVINGGESPPLPYPNPAKPTTKYEPAGVFNPTDNTAAPDWADPISGGGTAIRFDFPNPEQGVKIRLQVMIYDMVGNGVQSGLNDEFLDGINGREDQAATTGLLTAYLYWNGTNAAGMVVAPGVYRVVIYLDYRDVVDGSGLSVKYADKRKVLKIGIKSR